MTNNSPVGDALIILSVAVSEETRDSEAARGQALVGLELRDGLRGSDVLEEAQLVDGSRR